MVACSPTRSNWWPRTAARPPSANTVRRDLARPVFRQAATAGAGAVIAPAQPCQDVARVKQAAQFKLLDINARIAELERIRHGLQALISACPGHGRAEACPILNALTQEESQ